jgi:hypothetical protein
MRIAHPRTSKAIVGHIGMLVVGMTAAATLLAQTGSVPAGFTRLFNGRDLRGWHLSRSNHHGTTGNWHVENGQVIGAQRPLGQGGILLTDRKYKDFEFYAEVNPDHECDGGIFMRSTETGSGYQVDITARGENPPMLALLGEDMRITRGTDMAERKTTPYTLPFVVVQRMVASAVEDESKMGLY